MGEFLIRLSAMNSNFGFTEMMILLKDAEILINHFPLLIIKAEERDIDFYIQRSIFCKSLGYFITHESLSLIKSRSFQGLFIDSDYIKHKSGTYIEVSGFGKSTSDIRDLLIKYAYPLNSRPSTTDTKSKIQIIVKNEIVYFAEEYCETNRKNFLKWGIKNRKFIGHTSLDLELAVFMINACRLDSSSILYDPCCGSCSILHAAAMFGIYGIGTEIERRELVGRNIPVGRSRTLEKGYNVFSNFDQFKVPNHLIVVTVGDMFNPPVHNFDAILTDPPYGIRASIHGNDMLRFYKQLLLLGNKCRYVGFWALSQYKEAINEIFNGNKLICSLDQRVSNYTRTLFIYEMTRTDFENIP